jgi:hypothetical protein
MRRMWAAGAVVVTFVSLGAAPLMAQSEMPDSLEVLFVGNSFTYYPGIVDPGVDDLFRSLVQSEDPPRAVEVDRSTMGGATLQDLAKGTAKKIPGSDYDVVVLQGDIPEDTAHTVDGFLEAARTLDADVRGAGGRSVFYMAWPYVPLEWIGLDGIAAAHRQVEQELGTPIAPVGLAFANALGERPELAMLAPDLGHPSVHGAYLAAAVIYATIFDRSPEGLPFRPDGVSSDEAAFLQRVAWETLGQWRGGIEVPGPASAGWVTGTQTCWFDSDTGTTASTTYLDGVWQIRGLTLQCSDKTDDPRVSGLATYVWNCDCQFGIGSPVFGLYELTGPDGSWVGEFRGTRSVDGAGHTFLDLEGTDAYEGLTYRVDQAYDATSTSIEGVIFRDEGSTAPPTPPAP